MTDAPGAGQSDRDTLPIDPSEPMATQSRQALMIAHDAGWLTYRQPVDMRHDDQVQQLRDELGPDAELPNDDGSYYLIYVTAADRRRFPLLIPEGEARAVVFAIAAARSPQDAVRVRYRHGMLPL